MKFEFLCFVPVKVLLGLPEEEERCMLRLSRRINVPYATLCKILDLFEEEGIIKIDRFMKGNIIKMTHKGKKIKHKLVLIKEGIREDRK